MAAITKKALVNLISERTGYPTKMVHHVLDEFWSVLGVALQNGADIHFEGLFKIRAYERTVAPRLHGKARPVIRKFVLGIKPVRAFRKEMGSWKSLASSPPTTTQK